MSEQGADRIWSGIDIPKTIAGVLAAVSAAVVGSFLGVAGTLVGAALASVVGSVGTEIYRRFIHHGTQKVKSTFIAAPAAVGTPDVAATTQILPSAAEAPPERATSVKMRWGRVSVVAAGVFLLAMGTLTAFEMITGRSAADAVGSSSGSNTTLCSVLGCDKTATSNDTTVVTPSESATPTEEPTTTPTTETPTYDTTTEPTATQTDTATTAPTETDTQGTDGSVTDGGTGTSGTDSGADSNNEVQPQQTAQPQDQGTE